jgi:hypothetical protein
MYVMQLQITLSASLYQEANTLLEVVSTAFNQACQSESMLNRVTNISPKFNTRKSRDRLPADTE